jgi:excinuclease ABC subunit B
VDGRPRDQAAESPRQRGRRARQEPKPYRQMTPAQVVARIQQLEKQMYRHARDLEFEEAASIRDQISELRQQGPGAPVPVAAAANDLLEEEK